MKYKLLYTKTAFKDIKKLDRIRKRKIKAKIENYSTTPLKKAIKMTDLSLGTYRWRIGIYRVIFDIEGKDIVILRIRHRKEVYLKK